MAYLPVVVQILTSVSVLVGVVVSVINTIKIHQVHLTLNSRLDAMLRSVREAGINEGRAAAAAAAATALVASTAAAAASALSASRNANITYDITHASTINDTNTNF